MVNNRRYYDSVATHYDTWHLESGSVKIVDEVNRRRLFAVAGKRKYRRALDLACGSGRVLPWLTNLSESRWGLDLSESLLRIARQRDNGATLVAGEVLNLPFEDASFDIIVVNGALHHFFSLRAVIHEISRVLEPRGLLAVLGEPQADWNSLRNPFFLFSSAVFTLGRSFAQASRAIRRGSPKDDLCREPDAETISPGDLENFCQSSGLSTIEI